MTENEIINRVAESDLITINLEDFYPKGERVVFDLKNFLFEELILKEKDFREQLKVHDWNQYKDKFVALCCTADAIVPTWAFMLISAHLEPFAKKIVFGDLKNLESVLFSESMADFKPEDFKDRKIIIKGCSKVEVPESAFVKLTLLLRPFAHSIMYGEPCSTVPLFKRKS